MTDLDLWWCPRCQTSNATGAVRCVVCDDARPSTASAPPAPAATESAVLFASPDAPTSVTPAATAACGRCGSPLRPGHPFCGSCGAAVGPATPAGDPLATTVDAASTARSSNRTWIWAVSTLVIVIAVATGVFVLARPKPSDSAQPVRTKDGADSTDQDPSGEGVSTGDGTRTTLTVPTTAPTTAVSTAVITAPTTTPVTPPPVRPAAERSPLGTPTPVLDALDVAQELATALAHDDWTLVRQLEPGKSNLTDAKFYSQYNDLDESTAILVSSSQQGSSYALRLGLVAHQNNGQSSIYCVTWVVNASARTVSESTTGTKTIVDHAPGTFDPLQQVDSIRIQC